MKNCLKILLVLFFLTKNVYGNTNKNIYQKIDLFGEVLEKIQKEYVEEVDQSEMIDSAINGFAVTWSLFCLHEPGIFESMETDTKGEFMVWE